MAKKKNPCKYCKFEKLPDGKLAGEIYFGSQEKYCSYIWDATSECPWMFILVTLEPNLDASILFGKELESKSTTGIPIRYCPWCGRRLDNE